MPTAENCPRCQTPVPVDSPRGACPACLLRVALGDTPVPTGAVRNAGPGTIEYRDVGTTDLTPAADTAAFGPSPVAETPANTPRPAPMVAPGGPPRTVLHDGTCPAADGTATDRGASTADFQPDPPRRTGSGPPGYEVLGELGRGGMGVVYKARQVALDRIVALKVVLGIGSTHHTVRERFAAEARALGRLKHPNIVQVYEVGEDSGCPFYALEYVAGGALAGRLRSGPLAPKEAAELIRALARAVGAAHAAGILHRDIKPANVLLSEVNEPSVDAAVGRSGLVPKLTDFGLVKWLDESDGPTGTNSVMGTPSYMAPEQAAGRNKDVGPRTDVYALGATLYETLTGEPPFRADSPVATIALVVNAEPVRPNVKRPGLSAELEAICLKCLEKSPDSRYPSADALADDLGRWLRGESTLARPLGRVRRLWRRVKRRRWALAAVGAVVLAAGGAFAAASYLGPEPERVEVRVEADPDAPLKEIQAELADRKAVTLIGQTGLPRWHRWAHGQTALGESIQWNDKACAFQTSTLSLLELVTDPMCDAYEFSAEVRQDGELRDPTASSEPRCNVGVYFGYRKVPIPEFGDVYQYSAIDYSEIPIPELPPIRAQWNETLLVHRATGARRETSTARAGDFRFEQKGLCPGPWRRLTIVARDRSVRVGWGEPGPDQAWVSQPVAVLAASMERNVQRMNIPKGGLIDQGMNLSRPPTRSPLGIIALNSKISVRNVSLKPIP